MRHVVHSVLCALLLQWSFGCGAGQRQLSNLEVACGGLCESVRACSNQINTIVDLNDCELEFCNSQSLGNDVVVQGGSQACEAASTIYIDCATGMTCQQYDESGIIALFAGAAAVGCENEASAFRLACVINP